jgi:hypothetical protein
MLRNNQERRRRTTNPLSYVVTPQIFGTHKCLIAALRRTFEGPNCLGLVFLQVLFEILDDGAAQVTLKAFAVRRECVIPQLRLQLARVGAARHNAGNRLLLRVASFVLIQ